MANDNGDIWLVYNGEIYNFLELRKELEAAGERFRTKSDTEVVLRLYERSGSSFVERLQGMFALALWDGRTQTLILARDRIGIKPLYYYAGSSHVAFASELKGLLVNPRTPRDLDHAALADYLHLLSIPDPRSILRGVVKLPPGHLLTIKNGRVSEQCYWRIPLTETPRAVSIEDVCSEFDDLFGKTVKSHMIADVPVGAFLSGGVDSSAIVAFMAPEARAGMYTFSTTFRGHGSFDEGPFARMVAERYGTIHCETDLDSNAAAALPDVAWHCDEPFAISSALAVYFLSRRAREDVKVVLTGDGADEVFAGYTWKHVDFPTPSIRAPAGLLGVLRQSIGLGRRFAPQLSVWRKAESLIEPGERYLRSFTCLQNEDLCELVSPELWPHLERAWAGNITQGYFDETWRYPQQTRKLYTDMRSTLVSEMLTKIDRLTMAAGLEARVPFLDHKIVEWAFSLAPELKMHGAEGKFFIKRALESRLPRDVLYRPKHGFNVPLGRWLRVELREMCRDLLSPETVRRRGIFRPEAVTSMLDAHEAGQDDIGNRIFALMMLELWWREVFDRQREASAQAI